MNETIRYMEKMQALIDDRYAIGCMTKAIIGGILDKYLAPQLKADICAELMCEIYKQKAEEEKKVLAEYSMDDNA